MFMARSILILWSTLAKRPIPIILFTLLEVIPAVGSSLFKAFPFFLGFLSKFEVMLLLLLVLLYYSYPPPRLSFHTGSSTKAVTVPTKRDTAKGSNAVSTMSTMGSSRSVADEPLGLVTQANGSTTTKTEERAQGKDRVSSKQSSKRSSTLSEKVDEPMEKRESMAKIEKSENGESMEKEESMEKQEEESEPESDEASSSSSDSAPPITPEESL